MMDEMNDTHDGELLRRFQAERNEAAFTALVQRHQGLVFAVCRSVLGAAPEADDAAQATFLVLAQKASSLVNQPSVAGWLHRVAWNLSTRAARDARLRQQREQEAADMMAMADSGHGIPRDQLHEALAALPDKFRQALVLRHIEGCSEEETAKLAGCGLGAMSTRLSRARDLLRQKLIRHGIGVVSAGAVLAALTAETQAAVPVTFAAVTAKAATAAGAGAISASAATMAQGALHLMWLAKVKLTAVIVAAVTLLAGTGSVATVKLVAAHRAKVTEQIRLQLQKLYDGEAKLYQPTRTLLLPRQWNWKPQPFDPHPTPGAAEPSLQVSKTIEQITGHGDRVVVIIADRTTGEAFDETGKRRTVEQVMYTEEHWERQADGQWKKVLVKPMESGKETKL
jgi:RNA polymerase sigma factor (sigma-70 family)